MGLFGKKEEKKSCCEIEIIEEDGNEQTVCDCADSSAGGSGITVMEPGSEKRHQFDENANQVANELKAVTKVE